MYRDKFGYFHLSSLDEGKAGGFFFVTRDFSDVLRCRRTDSQHLQECKKVIILIYLSYNFISLKLRYKSDSHLQVDQGNDPRVSCM